MFVSAYIHPKWFEDDKDLYYLKQIGIDHVGLRMDILPGYQEEGIVLKSAFMALVDRLVRIGLKIERVVASGPSKPTRAPDLQEEIDKLCRIAEMLGEAGVRVLEPETPSMLRANIQASYMAPYFFQGQYAGQLIDPNLPGWSERAGRGGYIFPAFRLTPEHTRPVAAAEETREKLWEDLMRLYRQLIPVAERAHVYISQHGADPPFATFNGRAQILYCHAEFDRLFREFPSPNNCMTFCTGTRFESGEDMLEGIRRFGRQKRIQYVHFRNVRGTLARDGGYEERMTDDGDIDMMAVVRTLHEVGYEGALDYDHVVLTHGDNFLGRQSAAFSAGYIRGLLAAL
jgi:mannonate dehydratase